MQNVTVATSPPAPVESVDTNPTSGDGWRGVRTQTIICKFDCDRKSHRIRPAMPYDQNVPTTDSRRSRSRYLHELELLGCVCVNIYVPVLSY